MLIFCDLLVDYQRGYRPFSLIPNNKCNFIKFMFILSKLKPRTGKSSDCTVHNEDINEGVFLLSFLLAMDTLTKLTSAYPVLLPVNLNIFSYARFSWMQLSLSLSFSKNQNHIRDPLKHLRCIILQKQLTTFNR